MNIEIKQIDLLALKDKSLWRTVKNMTVRGYSAIDTFNRIHRRGNYAPEAADMLLLYVDGKPVAWNVAIGFIRSSTLPRHCELWAYTSSKHRKKGYQKAHLLPVAKQLFGKGLRTQQWGEEQKRTFKHYDEA